MKIVPVKVYQFEELSDRAKETARDWFRSVSEYPWNAESYESIKAFLDRFGVTLRDYEVGGYRPSVPCYKLSDTEGRFDDLELNTFTREHMPTGYCLDCALWETFYDIFSKTGDAEKAFYTALDKAFAEWAADIEYHDTEEAVDESITANEYDFTEDGRRF